MYSASVECTGGISFLTLSSCLRIPITLTVVVYGWSLQSCRAAAALQDWGGVHPPHGPSQNVLPRPQLDPRHIRQRVDRRRRPGCTLSRESRGESKEQYTCLITPRAVKFQFSFLIHFKLRKGTRMGSKKLLV